MSGARAAYMTDEIVDALQGADVEGKALRIVRQLDRKLYAKVNQVLETLGGKWNRKAKAHLFDRCPRAVIAAAMGREGTEEAPDELARDRIKRLQSFQTPDLLADRMADWVTSGVRDGPYLEPSAGRGRIVRPLLLYGAGPVDAVEIDEGNCDRLEDIAAESDTDGRLYVHRRDFLEWAAEALADPAFEGFAGIAMNPPFRNNQDIAHVLAAARLLKPGGRLAAIMSPHSEFAMDRASADFRARLAERPGVVIEHLPPGTFGEEGTEIGARLLFITRPN